MEAILYPTLEERAIAWNKARHPSADACRRIQRIVHNNPRSLGDIDGAWGPRTVQSIAAWQGTKGLVQDGMWGSKSEAAADQQSDKPISNCLIMGGERFAVAGYQVVNFLDDGEAEFSHRARRRPPEHIVLHESVTRSYTDTVAVLQRRGLGVHLMVHGDGIVSQHVDLADECTHGNQLNGSSIGLEIINPYYPKYVTSPWRDTIPARWWTHTKDGDERYLLPTEDQLEALVLLVETLTDIIPSIPLAFPTSYVDGSPRRIDGWDSGKKPPAGVVAHRDYSGHSDGKYPLEHLISFFDKA